MEEIKLYHKVWMALPPLLILLGLSIVAIIPLSQGKGPSVLELFFTVAVRWVLSLGSFRSYS